ncbi:hypothetical protein [Salegentibacter sp. Hel_I_6]|uniref:hypothetical protein n=1 Tax=Salegentibacter sp. Hel_I_6 TaxID=1250278 RepID=UPI0005682CD0|nr:hypothetical protein [Salegentibacter sp. Hel_I_6]
MKKSFKQYLSLLFFFIIGALYSQDTIVNHYISISHYKEDGNKLTKKDTANFRFYNGDTLVAISPDYKSPMDKNKVIVAYEPKDSIFLNLYKNVVYNTGKSQNEKLYMRYWKDSIKVFFEAGVSDQDAKELMQFAYKISKDIDSLNIKRVFLAEDANYRVYYLNSEYKMNFEPRIKGNSGYYVNWNAKNQIYKADLKINTDLVEKGLSVELLKFHFFRSLGYFKGSKNLSCESYLSGCNNLRQLSKPDLELLKYHYSYGVCKGVNLEDFEELHAHMKKSKEQNPNVPLYVMHRE